MSRQSSIHRLDPYFDNGLLRVGKWLSKGSLPEETKHPLIFTKDQHVATLIIKHIHQHLTHNGRNHTLSMLRKTYWVMSGNAARERIITNCCYCRRYNGETRGAPFTNVGDYFGPIEVRKGRGTVKRYGVILNCLASRAVHLEVANSMDTDVCINAFSCFICRRGQVACIQSDNVTNFIGAERELWALASLHRFKEFCNRMESRGALILRQAHISHSWWSLGALDPHGEKNSQLSSSTADNG